MKQRFSVFFKALGLCYGFFFVLRVLFYCFYFDFYSSFQFSTICKAFWVGTLFDTVPIFYTNILFVVLLFLPFNLLQYKWWRILVLSVFVITNTLALALNYVDLAYFGFSQKRTGAEILFLLKHSNGTIGPMLTEFWLQAFLFIANVAVLLYMVLKFNLNVPNLTTIKQYTVATFYFLLTIGFSVLAMRGGLFRTPLFTQDAAKFVDAKVLALSTNSVHQVISTAQTKPMQVNELLPPSSIAMFYSPYHHYTDRTFSKKNIVILILESFDKEYIGFYNKGKGYTPFLDSLLAKGLTYDNSFASGTTSIECPPAIFSGLPSIMSENYINSQYNTNRLSGLGDLLTKEGYKTGFYHGGENGTMNFDAFIGMTNFGKYYGLMQYPKYDDFDGNWGIWDEPYLQYFANELNNTPQPFCKAVFTLSSHHPYNVPGHYKKQLPKGTMPIHQSVAYADMALRKFFKTIEKESWFKNTLFVITGDHASVTDNPNYNNYFGDYCVPILFYEAGMAPQRIKDKVIQHKDITPSILYKLGYDKQFLSFGSNVFSEAPSFSVTYKNGLYYYFTYPYMLETDLNNYRLYNYINNAEPVSQLKSDSIINHAKAYIQSFQYRVVNNETF